MAEKKLSSNLHKAKSAKQDEFYTQIEDIEKELKHYHHHFKDKVVYCNADDPYESHFFKFFALNFNFLGLKKLIATSYINSPIIGGQLSLLDIEGLKQSEKKQPYKFEINEVKDFNKDGAIDLLDMEWLLKNDKNVATPLEGDGDFRSQECIDLLKQVDVVVTNPPFSLFREYVDQLVEYKKHFIIMGSVNAISYKETFKLIHESKLWLGVSNGAKFFRVPKSYLKNDSQSRKKDENGNGVARVGICWYTNLEHSKRHEDLILYRTYNEADYPKYDNYDAINVDKTKDIPMDYAGKMGVPITFIDKHNPDQFEIIALGQVGSIDYSCNKKMEILEGKSRGKFTYNAYGNLYRKYNPETDKNPAFKNCETGELYTSIYARIIIRNKKV